MNQEEYDAFWQALTTAEEAPVHGFEDGKVFEGCMPVEVMARRGHDTLLYGPLKSRGLDDPRTGRWPYAVVQLRRDNADGTVYNLVGFQTHLRFPEQRRVFSMIPALHDAEFLRYGVMHRNTFLNSPRLLDRYYRLKKEQRISFAGQMTGVEGYVESAASGFLVGVETARRLQGKPPVDFPQETAIGALGLYVSNESVTVFQPMNINFGIMPPLDHRVKGKRNKNAELSQRSLAIIDGLREESFFILKAVAGSSAISTTSVAPLISTPAGSVFSPQASTARRISSVRPTRRISSPWVRFASSAPWTMAPGALSPPMASTMIFMQGPPLSIRQ